MQPKLIVTHQNPDLDAVASIWLLKRFDAQTFGECQLAFVQAGERISKSSLEELSIEAYEVVHVDTGKGEFDHHTSEKASREICAATLVYDHLLSIHPELSEDEALARVVAHVLDIDHFGEVYWPEPSHDRYLFMLESFISRVKTTGGNDEEIVEFGSRALDAIYANFKERAAAETEIETNGKTLTTVWGQGLSILSSNEEVMRLAQQQGRVVVIRKDPESGHIRIKALPGKNIDLTPMYEKITRLDSSGTWYLHPSKAMLLNGSRKNTQQVASPLTLDQIESILAQMG